MSRCPDDCDDGFDEGEECATCMGTGRWPVWAPAGEGSTHAQVGDFTLYVFPRLPDGEELTHVWGIRCGQSYREGRLDSGLARSESEAKGFAQARLLKILTFSLEELQELLSR